MIKKLLHIFKKVPVVIAGLSIISTLGFAAIADASSTTSVPATNISSTAEDKVSSIISKGDNEISRRLKTLGKLDGVISSSVKISASDKTTLTTEVNNEVSGLNSDLTTLNAATTLTAAHTAAQAIFTDYRVYALVVPQIYLIKAADRQQLIEAMLNAAYATISADLASNPTATETADLKTMNTDITSAQAISVSVETAVLALTPSNYNGNHAILAQYYTSLKTAQSDIAGAIAQAKTLIALVK